MIHTHHDIRVDNLLVLVILVTAGPRDVLTAEDLHHQAEAGEQRPVKAGAAGGRVLVSVLSQEPDITIIIKQFSLFYSADSAEQSRAVKLNVPWFQNVPRPSVSLKHRSV